MRERAPVQQHAGREKHTRCQGQTLPLLALEPDLGHIERMVGADPGEDLLGVVTQCAIDLGEQGHPARPGRELWLGLGLVVHEVFPARRSASSRAGGTYIVYLGAPP